MKHKQVIVYRPAVSDNAIHKIRKIFRYAKNRHVTRVEKKIQYIQRVK